MREGLEEANKKQPLPLSAQNLRGEIINQCEPGAVKQSSLRSLKGCRLHIDWEAPKSFCLVWRKEIPEGFQEKVPCEIGLWKRYHLEIKKKKKKGTGGCRKQGVMGGLVEMQSSMGTGNREGPCD